jgi:hypothetical protein
MLLVLLLVVLPVQSVGAALLGCAAVAASGLSARAAGCMLAAAAYAMAACASFKAWRLLPA